MYKTKISVYPSCLSTLVHNDVTISELYDKIKNEQAFIQGNECIGKAIPADYDAAHPLSDTRQEGIPTYAQWQQARLSRGGAGGYGDQQSSNCLHCRLAVLTVRELTLPLMPLLFLNFYNNEYNIYFLYTYTYLYISY